MIDRRQIVWPIAYEFKQFEEDFARSLHSDIPLLQSAIEQVLLSNGKHIRPLLLLLTAKVCGEPTKETQLSAVIIETLHTTTLIHDDVVDETKQRRGIPSINAIFDNRIAVLAGDYILSSSIISAAEIGNIAIIKTIALVCRELSEGELLQINNTEKRIINENDYLLLHIAFYHLHLIY
jgi:octaprenyl-diphosphate synthase